MAGLTEAACARRLERVPGIELSAFVLRKEVHILGRSMVAKLQALGLPVTLKHVLDVARAA